MTANTLRVLVTPSPLSGVWREAIAGHAAQLGFHVLDDEQAHVSGEPSVVFYSVATTEHDPSDWIVLADTSDAAITALRTSAEDTAKHLTWTAASLLGPAAALAESGAPVFDMRSDTVILPGLGQVSRPPSLDIVQAHDRLNDALRMYDALPPMPGPASFWEPDQFSYTSSGTSGGGTSLIDMTGRGRIVLFGPHFTLSPGQWEVEIKFSIDPEGREAHLRFEWGVGNDVAFSYARIKQAGLYSVNLERVWTVPGSAEVRIWVYQPMFSGTMEFLGCNVSMTKRIRDVSPEDLLAAENSDAPADL
jgi:hypothetical protein